MKTVRYLLLVISILGVLTGIGLSGFGLLDIWNIGSKISGKELWDYVNHEDPNMWSLRVGIPLLVLATVALIAVFVWQKKKKSHRDTAGLWVPTIALFLALSTSLWLYYSNPLLGLDTTSLKRVHYSAVSLPGKPRISEAQALKEAQEKYAWTGKVSAYYVKLSFNGRNVTPPDVWLIQYTHHDYVLPTKQRIKDGTGFIFVDATTGSITEGSVTATAQTP